MLHHSTSPRVSLEYLTILSNRAYNSGKGTLSNAEVKRVNVWLGWYGDPSHKVALALHSVE